jgi:hypothetical protein
LQVPPEHVSVFSGSHVLQAPPPVPHVVVVAVLQTSPAQHPLGQVVASQTHAPPTHFDPGLHAGPVPQVHAPLQESEEVGSQVAHPPPAVPHEEVDGALQTLPAQHPVGHDVALHTHAPPTQA